MPSAKRVSLVLLTLVYLGSGINHFWHARLYQAIMPPYLPYPTELIYISGICEILLALLLIPAGTRVVAAWLIMLLLIAVYPANIQMTINYWYEHNPHLWITLVRLPIQFLLVWWAWTFTKRPTIKPSGSE